MFKTFRCLVEIFWVMDLMNMPFMKMFDTTYPLNGLFWLITLLIFSWENDGLKLEVKKDE